MAALFPSDAPMRTRLPPNVTSETNRHGTRVFYYRVGKGARIRLPAYGTPEFEPAYRAALAGAPLPVAPGSRTATIGTIRWAIGEYKQSLHWRGLDEVTRRRRDSFFQQMIDQSGERALTAIRERDIVDAREKRTGGKGHAANNFLKAIKPLFAYARERGWIETDPTRPVSYARVEKGSRLAWDIDDLRAFEQRHPLGTTANLALRIMLFTGLRRSDAIRLGRQHLRDGKVKFRPGKTEKSSGVVVTFTALPPLLEAIAATPTSDLTFLTSGTGQPFASAASFGNWFRDRCIEAEVPARAHGLRKLGTALAAEAGASANELMAMFGWTTLEQPELYTRSANREILGDSAASKLLTGYHALVQTETNIPRTSETGAGIAEKR